MVSYPDRRDATMKQRGRDRTTLDRDLANSRWSSTDALGNGSYGKTLSFTLSTTTP
jgi:hypothetical protein